MQLLLNTILHPRVVTVLTGLAALLVALALVGVVYPQARASLTEGAAEERYDDALAQADKDRHAAVVTSPGFAAVADIVAAAVAQERAGNETARRGEVADHVYSAFVHVCRTRYGTVPVLGLAPQVKFHAYDVEAVVTRRACAPTLKEQDR